MKSLFFLSSVCAFLAMQSCAGNDEDNGGIQKEYLTESSPESDSVIFYASFSEETSRELEKYFALDLLTRLDQNVLSFNEMKTDVDFEKYYNDSKELFDVLYEALNEPKTDYLIKLASEEDYWNPVNTILPDLQDFNGELGAIHISCAVECSDIEFYFDLNAMKTVAKKTEGKADDDFIDLVLFVEGAYGYGYAGYPGFKSWFEQTWDLGGASLIGEGIMLEAINKTIKFQKKHKTFAEHIELIRMDFINDLSWGYAYNLSPEQILKEYDDIIDLNYFTEEELKEILEMRTRIENGDETLQFNCKTGDCSYG